MDGEVLCEAASNLVASVRANRPRRAKTIEAAQAARRESRWLRRQSEQTRERHLQHGWRLWSAGLRAQPPALVPQTWAAELASENVHETAREACKEAHASAAGFCASETARFSSDLRQAFAIIAGATSVAETHLSLGEDGDAIATLAVCIRVVDGQETALSGKLESAEAVLAASAARRFVSASRRALAAAYGEL